jgi:hypothetical protein
MGRYCSSTPATTSRATRSRTNNDHALTINSDLVAFAQLTFAFSTQSVNGVAGKPVPGGSSVKLPAPAGPVGTFPDETP